MDGLQKTKPRRPNFSTKELNILIDEVTNDPELGRGELGGRYKTTLELRKRWEDIAITINATECMSRTGDEIKNKFADLRTKTKKKAAEIKKHREQTGGGEPFKLHLTDLEEKVLGIIGLIVVDGIKEGVDTFLFANEDNNNFPTTSKNTKIITTSEQDVDTNKNTQTNVMNTNKENTCQRIRKRKVGQTTKARRKQTNVTRTVLTNQENILREMKVTNCLLRKLVILKKREVDFLIESNTVQFVENVSL